MARAATVQDLCMAVAAAVAAVSTPATAAVRLCAPPISSGPVLGTTENTARAAALAIWTSKARAHGEPYASWRLAAEKMLACKPRGDGAFECFARAAPCTIEQAPDRRELRRKRIGI